MPASDDEPLVVDPSRSPLPPLRHAVAAHGAESSLIRHLNRNTVVRFLRDSGGTHGITDIAARTELSRPTVDLALRELLESGMVVEAAPTSGSRRGGRPARAFRFDAGAGCVVAVTVARGRVTVTVTDLRGTLIGETAHEFGNINHASDPIGTIRDQVRDCLADRAYALDQVRVVVMAVRGVVAGDGVIQLSGDLPTFVGQAAHERLRAAFGCPVLVENDANLATLAEHRTLPEPATDLVGLLLSDAVGCGLVLDGRLYRGAHGGAGEFGRDADNPWGAAHDAIQAYVSERGASYPAFYAEAAEGREPARSLVTDFAERLAIGLGKRIVLLDPPIVVVGGDIVHAGETFMRPFRAGLEPVLDPAATVVFSSLGSDCLRMGALQLGFQWLDEQLFRMPERDRAASGS